MHSPHIICQRQKCVPSISSDSRFAHAQTFVPRYKKNVCQRPQAHPAVAMAPAPTKPAPEPIPSYKAATSASTIEKWHRLVLTTTSLRNVVLANSTDVIYYEVITPRWARGSTTVSRLDPNTHQFDIIGEMKNNEHGKAAQVRLYGGALKSVREFLQGDNDSVQKGISWVSRLTPHHDVRLTIRVDMLRLSVRMANDIRGQLAQRACM